MRTYEYGNPSADILLIQPVDEQDLSAMENETREIRRLTASDFHLIAVKIDRWNHDLSPWPAPPVFGKEGFGDGAQETLRKILTLCGCDNRTIIIGGYSLAGLFSLWTAYQTDAFTAVAAASPSVWFPDFLDYMKEHEIRARGVYLSLGDKEEKTRNPVMATVGERIREACALLTASGVGCQLEWNSGNHFQDSDIRTAKAFAWAIREAGRTGG